MAEAYANVSSSHGSGEPADVVHHGRPHVMFRKRQENENATEMQHIQDADNGNATDVLEIIVYFPDNTGVQVKVRDGQNIEAGELFEVVKEVMEFPDIAREVFSLWLVSDLLELQLKPNHVPFKLVCYWEELLEKYTTATEERIQRDEPVIMFKRNVFFPRASEKDLSNKKLLCCLYSEAKKNILVGHYPLSQEQCDTQAGIQAVIMQKEMKEDKEKEEESSDDSTFGTAAFFKSRLNDFLPPHFCRRHWIYKTRENPERRLAEKYNSASEDYRLLSLNELYLKYLEICHKQPYYGSAFFRGQAEHPATKGILSKYLSTKDDPVYVAINIDGVFIIDMDDFALLIGFYYENLSWQFVEVPQNLNNPNPNCLPCLFLQFPSEDRSRETKLLQIFSREAFLMDNLIEACVVLKRSTGSTRNRDDCQTIIGKGSLAETFNRLALMTFSGDGKKMLRSTVRRPKQTPASAEPIAGHPVEVP